MDKACPKICPESSQPLKPCLFGSAYYQQRATKKMVFTLFYLCCFNDYSFFDVKRVKYGKFSCISRNTLYDKHCLYACFVHDI